MLNTSRILGSATLAACLVAGICLLDGTGSAEPQDAARQAPPPGAFSGEALVRGLKATKGCLGVETGSWDSGKETIAAWFEDKAAVKRWYYSDVHEMVMGASMGGVDVGEPLGHIKDDEKPIMVLATLTPSATPKFEGFPLPISQISIEMFKPLPGGAQLGGRLAPATFKVPHMTDYTPKPAGAVGGNAGG